MSTVDMASALKLLDQVHELCSQVDGGRRVNPSMVADSKKRASMNADISRTLLYAAHVADAARLEILNQYQMFKGEEDVPSVQP